MQSISANYTVPTILNSMTPAAGKGLANSASGKTSAATTSRSASSAGSASGLGSTFLSLLAQELQNQDPTAPVDPTAMVGQMISLNQLEQLISINQTVTGSATGTTTEAAHAVGNTASTAALASANDASALSPSVAGASANQLPFDPNTMMPLGYGNTAAMAASINSSLNPATMGFSSSSNYASGGK